MSKKDKGLAASAAAWCTIQEVYALAKAGAVPLSTYTTISDALAMRADDTMRVKVGKKKVDIDVERLVASGWTIATEENHFGEVRPFDNEQVWVLLAYPKKGGGVTFGQGYAIYLKHEGANGEFFMDVTEAGDLQTRSAAIKQGFTVASVIGWRNMPQLPVGFR